MKGCNCFRYSRRCRLIARKTHAGHREENGKVRFASGKSALSRSSQQSSLQITQSALLGEQHFVKVIAVAEIAG